MIRTRTILLVGSLGILFAACGGSSDPVRKNDGATGTTDGAGAKADSAAVKTDAAVVQADTGTVQTDTASVQADGSVVQGDGAIVGTDTATALTDGAVVKSDTAMVLPDAAIMKKDAAVACSNTPDAGAACNTLANTADSITVSAGANPMPAGTGGTIVDGTYFLTELKVYPGSPVPSGIPFKQTILISGCSLLLAEGTDVHKNSIIGPVGMELNGEMVCSSKAGDVPTEISSYTATATTFTMYSMTTRFYASYTKQ
jgi:hypothetical protein